MPYKDKEKKKTYAKTYYKIHKEKIKACARTYYRTHKEKIKVCMKTYYKANSEKAKARVKEWRKTNPEKAKAGHLKHDYNLSLKQVNEMFAKQDYKCTICKQSLKTCFRPCVDHNHKTGKIRGILCSNCNKGLGYFLDNPEFLRNAILYIETN